MLVGDSTRGFRDLLIFVRYLDDKDHRTHKDFRRLLFPSLSDSSIENFKESAIKYLELCILKDKLDRIDSRIKVGQCDDILFYVSSSASDCGILESILDGWCFKRNQVFRFDLNNITSLSISLRIWHLFVN